MILSFLKKLLFADKSNKIIEKQDPYYEKRQLFLNRKHAEFNAILDSLERVSVEVKDMKVNRNKEIDLSFNTSNLTKSTSIKNLRTFVALDVETTGIRVGGNDIIEISAVKFIDFQPKYIFTTLLSPRKGIPEDATKINGITDAMVAGSPKFGQILDSLKDFIGKGPIVAHNAKFDIKHIYVSGYSGIEKCRIFDTCELSRRIDTDIENHKLATACAAQNIFFDGSHRASADALACGLLFVRLLMARKVAYSIDELLNES